MAAMVAREEERVNGGGVWHLATSRRGGKGASEAPDPPWDSMADDLAPGDLPWNRGASELYRAKCQVTGLVGKRKEEWRSEPEK